jgi:hypothetical protein
MTHTVRRHSPEPDKWFVKGRRRLVIEEADRTTGRPRIVRPETKREANQRVRKETKRALWYAKQKAVEADSLVLPEH